jgi:hypothetical protein
MKASEIAFGSLVEAEGQPAPLLDPVDAVFHRVALLVEIRIMADRASAAGSAFLALDRLVGLL